MQGGCPGFCTFQKEAELQISLEVCQFKQKRTRQFRYSLVLCGFVNSNFGLETPAGMLQLNKSQQTCGSFTSGQLHNSALNAKKKITKSKALSGNDRGNTAAVSTSPSDTTTRLLHKVESGTPRLPQQSRYVCTHTSEGIIKRLIKFDVFCFFFLHGRTASDDIEKWKALQRKKNRCVLRQMGSAVFVLALSLSL